MKTQLFALAGVIIAVLAFGTPANADKPGGFTEEVSFFEPDPCNGGEMETTLTLDVQVHDHRNVTVLVVDLTAVTDNGYSGSGRQAIVMAENHFAETLTAMATNADGDRYKVNVHVNGTPNGIATDRFSIRCVVDR